MPEFKHKLLLVDGHALLYRAYHALPGLTNSQGFPTGAIFGFFSMLLKALEDVKPSHVLVTFDVRGPTFRDKLSGDYKAHRKPAPDDLNLQLPKVKEILVALKIPIYEKAGFEADDLLGIISRLTGKDVYNIIATGDMDLLQLINPNTVVYRFKKGFTDVIVYDESQMKKEFGLNPDQWVDLKALKGDASDNIPGVPGIGEKTALELIKKFKTIKGVYKEAHKKSPDIKPAVVAKLLAGEHYAELSHKLAHIDTSNGLEFDFEKTKLSDYDQQEVLKLFTELNIKSLITKLPKLSKEALVEIEKTAPTNAYVIADTKNELENLRRKILEQKVFGLDAKGESLDINVKAGEIVHVPFESLGELKQVLEDDSIAKIGHDLKSDYLILRRYGIGLAPFTFDTQIASYLINPGRRTYELEDFGSILQLRKKLEQELKDKKLTKLFLEIEMPLIGVLSKMEAEGVKIDTHWLNKLSSEAEKEIKNLEKKIYKMAGVQFNISSPKQLGEVLFEKLQIPTTEIRKRGKTGAISTAAEVLEKLREQHPIIGLIFEYRELTKLKSTYLDALPQLVSPKDGRVHTTYSQTIAATGRLSSSDPNLQNIPIRTDLGREVRKAFVAKDGYKLVSIDYSQIELRIAAAISGDAEMIKIFKSGKDFHAATAARIFNCMESQVTPQQRRDAKTINFSVLYGVSAFGLSSRSTMARTEAQDFIRRYYQVFAGLKKYIDRQITQVHEKGFTINPLGRLRFYPDINSPNFGIRSAAERQAVNAPIQSLSADIIKMAMIRIAKEIVDPDCHMLLQVHDELVFEVKKTKLHACVPKIKEIMETVYSMKVPVVAEARVGDNWKEMEKLK